MQRCLEVVADAILQVVLFQVEADENASFLQEPDPRPLVEGVQMLLDLAKLKAAQWGETAQAENKERMLQMCTDLGSHTSNIALLMPRLLSDAYDQAAKDELLYEAKDAMVTTVRLLELADAYDILSVEKAAVRLQRAQRDIIATTMENLQEEVQHYIFESVTMAKEVAKRAEYVPDEVMSHQLLEANAILSSLPEHIIKLVVHLSKQPHAYVVREQLQQEEVCMLEAIDLVVRLTRESHEAMFRGLLMDLEPIDRNSMVNRGLPDGASCYALLDEMRRQVNGMGESERGPTDGGTIQRLVGAAKNLNSTMLRLRSAVATAAEETDSERLRSLIEDAARKLENTLKDLLLALKSTASNPNDMQQLDAACLRCLGALDALGRALEGDEGFDLLNCATSNVQKALAELRGALEDGDNAKLIAATKAAVTDLRGEGDGTADLRGLLEGTKAVVAGGEQDEEAVKRLLQALANCKRSTNLLSCVSPSWSLLQAVADAMQASRFLITEGSGTTAQGRLLPQQYAAAIDSVSAIVSARTFAEDCDSEELQGLQDAMVKLSSARDRLLAQLGDDCAAADREATIKEHDHALTDLVGKGVGKRSTSGLEESAAALLKSSAAAEHALSGLTAAIRAPETEKSKEEFTAAQVDAQRALIEQSLIAQVHDVHKGGVQEMVESVADWRCLEEEVRALSHGFAAAKDSMDVEKRSASTSETALRRCFSQNSASLCLCDGAIEVEVHAGQVTGEGGVVDKKHLTATVDALAQQQLMCTVLSGHISGCDSAEAIAQQRDLSKAAERASGAKKRLAASAGDVLYNPVDHIARARFVRDLTEVVEASEAMAQAAYPSLLTRMVESGEKLNSVLEKGPQEEPLEKKQLLTRFKKQLDLAEGVAGQCHEQRIKNALLRLHRGGTGLYVDCCARAQSGGAVEELRPKVLQVNRTLVDFAKKGGLQRKRAGPDTLERIVEECAAATKDLVVDGSPRGQLHALLKSISDNLAVMHAAADAMEKKGLINNAKSISVTTGGLAPIARLIIEPIQEKKARNQMLIAVNAAKNFSVQLKILAAVKTASGDGDPTADGQLITCARQLVTNVIGAVNAAEVCDIVARHGG